MKIPFTLDAWLKDKSQKVETRDGRLVKIISFEMTDTNGCPIAAQFRLCAGTPVVYLFDKEGHYKGEGNSDYDLFIITPEPELTEFEKRFLEIIVEIVEEKDNECPHPLEYASELLDLARKELEPEVLERLEVAYKNQDEVVYENGKRDGRAEALKDLPRWSTNSDPNFKPGKYFCVGNALISPQGWSIFFKDLEKLPGFKED